MFFKLFFLSSKIEDLLSFLKIGGEDGSSSAVFKTSSVILAISIILFAGFLMTRLTKLLKLPNVTAYIITGILIGPYVFNIIPNNIISGTEFLSDIALAFIAFSVGEFFKLDTLKSLGIKTIIITLFESIFAFIFVLILCSAILKIDISFSLVLAALSSTTAPASTMMTIKQTGAKGDYVNTLLAVVAFDDVIALVLYSISISVCIALNSSGSSMGFATVALPILENILCLIIGLVFGFILKLLLPSRRTTDNRLIIVIAVLFLFCGICALFGESPLLGCMGIGTVYANTCKNDGKLFKQLNYFSPPIMLCFFVRSGMNFDLSAFTSNAKINGIPLFLIAITYFFVRMLSKYSGAYTGCLIAKSPKKTRNFLGLGLIPQAGVAIGLAAMGARTFIDAGQIELGNALNTIILASSVLYELIGPACSKLGLYLSGSYTDIDVAAPIEGEIPKQKDSSSEIDKLVAQIQKIQSEIKIMPVNEEEDAFTEAAEEYTSEMNYYHRGFMKRK